MKRILLAGAVLALANMAVSADIKVNLPKANSTSEITIKSMPIAEYAKGRRSTVQPTENKYTPKKGVVTFATPEAASIIKISVDGADESTTIYTAPGDNLTVDIESLSPMSGKVSGSVLAEQLDALENQMTPLVDKLRAAFTADTPDEDAIEALFAEYDNLLLGYVAANPASPAAPFAASQVRDLEKRLAALEGLSDAAKQSILYPIAEVTLAQTRDRIETEQRQKALESGDAEAPNFTLPGLNGEMISLSDYRGKWVILDFWGSWCGWCIKGIPELKENYEKYKGKLEVIGIDCGDDEEDWREAVAKYQLPWVHVYNDGEGTSVDQVYAIQGYPTKIIINPEGKIADITTGEDPSFYTRLAELLK